MLILLPPSEGKAQPAPAPPLDLDALAYAAELGSVRARLLRALARTQPLAVAPAAPASEVYTGVLYGRLDLPTITGAGGRDLLIASGLWGLLRPQDRIPHYKLPLDAKVPRLKGTLAALWRTPVAKALHDRDTPDELVVDCRSGGYASVWKPVHAQLLSVRAFRVHPDGTRQPISHMAKASRGDVARALLTAPRPAASADEVADLARAAGLDVELSDATLDVLER
jgi:cytoplasmic iron level regulating protein YaaA (DUF328/UPF0246 family)